VDSLEVALGALLSGEPDAAVNMQRIALSLREPAQKNGFEAIAEAASGVESASPEDMAERVRELIGALRAVTARVERVATTLLLVGIASETAERLTRSLTSPDRETRISGHGGGSSARIAGTRRRTGDPEPGPAGH
ncbi:MAG: hypothetical protein HQ559_12910, partial [Lentisphaerae bacterium]|nr:hypothetical protein [Lentisphaerota bacterium]